MAKETAAVAGTVDVKFKDLRVAVVALNESKLLKKNIALVGITKDQILKDFMAGFDGIPDVDGKCPAPKAALDFYNSVVDAQEAAKAGTKPPAAEATAGAAAPAATKGKGKKSGAAAGEKKAPVDKGPGVISTILDLITTKGPITKEGILSELAAAFPDRDKEKMAKTVQVQIGGKKETRMEKEKGVKFIRSEKGEYSIAKAKK
jgi:hypothetical protein